MFIGLTTCGSNVADISDLHRMSRGDAASMREAFGHVPKQKVHSSSDSKFTSRCVYLFYVHIHTFSCVDLSTMSV